MRVAIVGAGVSGLTTAFMLLDKNPTIEIELFEKSKALGGRMATRRLNGMDTSANLSEWAVDTGCQFISIDQAEIRNFFENILPPDTLKEIPQPLLCLPDGFVVETRNRFFLAQGMTFWAKAILAKLEAFGKRFKLHLERPISQISTELPNFDAVFVSAPGEQGQKLGAKNVVEYRPCLSIMFSWHGPHELAQNYFAFRDIAGREGVVWLCHEGMKRGHPGLWLAQVSADTSVLWNEAFCKDKNFDALEDTLHDDMSKWMPVFAEGTKTVLDTKYWRLAFPIQFADTEASHAFELQKPTEGPRAVYFIGDGYKGVGRVENAIESAMSAAQHLLKNNPRA